MATVSRQTSITLDASAYNDGVSLLFSSWFRTGFDPQGKNIGLGKYKLYTYYGVNTSFYLPLKCTLAVNLNTNGTYGSIVTPIEVNYYT